MRELTQSWLRSSHRAVDPERSRQNQPWHPHDRIEPLTPNKAEELQIEVIPACNLFHQGHRIRLELSNCDSLVENSSFLQTDAFDSCSQHGHSGPWEVPGHLAGDPTLSGYVWMHCVGRIFANEGWSVQSTLAKVLKFIIDKEGLKCLNIFERTIRGVWLLWEL